MTQVMKEALMTNNKEESKRRFALQWHLTAKCSNKCTHCYLRNTEGEQQELENELSLEDCFKVIDDFCATVMSWDIKGRIYFTGGDPLLKKEIFSLIEYSRNKNIDVGLLGNPNFLDYQMAKRLKDAGVFYYQVSIDGLESTHDKIRGKGNFQKTIEAIKNLNNVGIPSIVMFTLSRENIDELIPVINLVSQEKVSSFDFARLVPIGMGKDLGENIIRPEEYRELLVRVLEEYKRLRKEGSQTFFGRKDNLWKLLYQELGLSSFTPREDNLIVTGCQMGIAGLTVVADGTVYVCRRLPIVTGKVPDQKIKEIFIESKEINEVREVGKMKKCSKCNLLTFCRGCPAVAYGFTGDYLSPDPQCWKRIQ